MKDLGQLKENLMKEIETEYKAKIAVATKERDERITQLAERLDQEEAERKLSLKQAAKSQQERKEQSILNQSKKVILQSKRELLKEVYVGTVHVMSQWSGETLQKFMIDVLSSLKLTGKIELIMGKETFSQLSKENQKNIQEQFLNISLVEDSSIKKAGFILRQAGVDYNYLFDELVEDLKGDFSPVLAQIAFKE